MREQGRRRTWRRTSAGPTTRAARARRGRSSDGPRVAQESARAMLASASIASVTSSRSCTPGDARENDFVVGDLPAPGGVAGAQRHDRGDGAAVERQPRDRCLAFGGERGDGLDARSSGRRRCASPRCRRGPSSRRLPAPGSRAARRVSAAGSAVVVDVRLPAVGKPLALPAQLLALLVRDRVVEIAGAVAVRRQHRAAVQREVLAAAVAMGERGVEGAARRRPRPAGTASA